MDNPDYLSSLPIDVFIHHITYLPFHDVISLCSTSSSLQDYCSNPRHSSRWKLLIDSTFSSVYDYHNKLTKIQQKVGADYNYLVYTQLINLLDPITQLMIYYRQGDMGSFNDRKFTILNDF